MDYLITLVHGTFATKAPWASEGSNLCSKIRSALAPEHKVDFFSFNWSGKNSNQARFSASEELAQVLKEQETLYPGKKKIIIAHSHGGNIAMYALKKLGNAKAKFSLVTMATPFLNSKVRSFENNIETHIILVPLLLCAIGFFLMLWMGIWVMDVVQLPKPVDKYEGAGFFFFIICSMAFLFNKGQKIHAFLKEETKTLPDELSKIMEHFSLQDTSCDYSILAVVDHSDEVRLWFEYLYRFWELILSLHEWLTSMIKWLVAAFGLSILAAVFFKLFEDTFKSASDFTFQLYMYVSYALLALALCIPVLTFLIPCLFLFIRSNPAILGWESWKSSLFIKTTPSTTPLGYKNLNFIQYDLKRRAALSLKHSIYEHDEVIDNLSHWIKKQGTLRN